MAGPTYFLVIRAPNGDSRELELDGLVVIGRDDSADVRVEDKKVSRRHAAFKLIDGQPYVEDLGSSNGVKLDGARIEKRSRVDRRSEVRVGGYVVTLRVVEAEDADPTSALDLDGLPGADRGTGPMVRAVPRPTSAPAAEGVALLGLEAPVAGRRFRLGPGESVIGRLGECDISVLHASVSRQHARVVVAEDGAAEVHDLGSANGVFVGGRRAEVAELAHGDELRIGEVPFRVELPAGARRPGRGPAARVRLAPRRADGRWVLLGVLGLLAAAAVLALAVLWQRVPEVRRVAQTFTGSSEGASPAAGEPARTSTAGASVAAAPSTSDASSSAPPEPAPASPSRPAAVAETQPAGTQPAAPAGADRPFGPVRTATSPWSPRDARGLPRDLPVVNPDFDYAGYVSGQLDAARAALEAGDRAAAESAVDALLAVDPIHEAGRELRERIAKRAAADEALARADALVAAGELASAYRILSSVPLDLPQAESARARAAELRERAVADAQRRARARSRSRSGWKEAHGLYRLALELEPDNRDMLAGLRELERRMRGRKMRFEAWRPSTGEAAAAASSAPSAPRSAALDAYLRGDLTAARKRARRARRRGGAEGRAAARLLAGIERVKGRFGRVRTEIPNDPSRAWAMLLELEALEQAFVPDGERSYLIEELRADLSDAFAKEGEKTFATQRYEAAFQRWEAGYKLDPTNPRVVAGLERLEEVAATMAEEARVSARRGANAEACERFRAVTRLTRAATELHREARKQAFKICP